MIIYFVVGIKYEQVLLWDDATSVGKFVVLMLVQLFSMGMVYTYIHDKAKALRITGICMGITLLALLFSVYVKHFDIVWVQLMICVGLIGYLVYQGLSTRFSNYLMIALFSIGSIIFFYSADYVLNDVMEPHQRVRIRRRSYWCRL